MSAPPEALAIADSLRRLDSRLMAMTEAARAETGREPGADPFRGLYVSETDIARLLSAPNLPAAAPLRDPLAHGERFDDLAKRYRLSAMELDALLLAVAPEIDLRYERIFAYLQDDVNRRRPSTDLALGVLGARGEERFHMRTIFHASAPLRRNGLIGLAGDESAPWLRRELHADARIVAFLAGDDGIDERLSGFVRSAPGAGNTNAADAGLLRLVRKAIASRSPLRVCVRGADEEEKRAQASACAATVALPLLMADVAIAARMPGGFEQSLEILLREAALRNAILHVEGLDAIPDENLRETFWRSLNGFEGAAIISSNGDTRTGRVRVKGLIAITFETPEWQGRRAAWKRAMQTRGSRPKAAALDALAECFALGVTCIEDAAESAAKLAEYRGEPLRARHAFEAARTSSGHELAALTHRVKPIHGWDDIVLPDEARDSLREICRRVERRHRVLEDWGFEGKLSGGKGVNALFHGHSGTGKTMAAEVVAGELHLDLYKIDLASVVSKYIGETEKNLDRIFSAASNANAILFFDEADALFGKRSEVRYSQDRYSNLEISYLLQKMEQHEGVSILATNLRQNLDDAFLRRLSFTISFPFPDEANRRKIWERIWPKKTPVCADVDAAWIASRFLLSGGNIRNVALAAAFLAVDDGGTVTLQHVLRAVEAEFRKMGKTLTAAELAPPDGSLAGVAA